MYQPCESQCIYCSSKQGQVGTSRGKLADGPVCRCPLLALSATIGNPHDVASWLRSVKALQQEQDAVVENLPNDGFPVSYDVELIQHTERYADLRYHIWQSATETTQAEPVDAASNGLPIPDSVSGTGKSLHADSTDL